MDPIQAAKPELSKDVASLQPEVVSEQPVTPEVLPVVEVVEKEKGVEESRSQEVEKQIEQQPTVVEQPLPPPPPAPVPIAKVAKDRLTQEIEEVMEEDLKELYMAMPKEKQAAFRAKGEETLSAVRTLLHAAHVNVKKIFQLIRDWLKMIPGVNRYFLEQEAKIKTDKIILVSEEEKKRGSQL
ncbi:MAG: hypothetical protein NTX72_02715 [Candidatus Uhrbacteria bacterium]|nr:hypothetical protein [Candidatus Uhrbacteria bacterium]